MMATQSIHSWSKHIPQRWGLYRTILPLLASGTMLGASLIPWIIDPLGKNFPAWQLPVDIGWQLRSNVFSYGLLCLGCALYAFFIAYLAWKHRRTERTVDVAWAIPLSITQPDITTLKKHYTLAGLLCLLPLLLFFTQFLFIDMGNIAQLTDHELQAMFITGHFGYGVAAQFIPIHLDAFDPSTSIHDRLALLLNQIQPGIYLPFLGTICLLTARHMIPQRPWARPEKPVTRKLILIVIAAFTLTLVVLGRGPAALVCRFQAEHLLSTGEYASALNWFDRASMLNPSLEELPSFHIEQGQAWYYLHPTQPNAESMAYLTDFYLKQDDYLSAYQQMQSAQQLHIETPTPTWLVQEFDLALTRLAEMQHPLAGAPVPRAVNDLPSIGWLNTLIQFDPTNVYAHYTLGRIEYDEHNYTACEQQMTIMLNMNSDPNILSSVYTYLSFSYEAEGNYVKARDYLFTAQDLDPLYRNNTAREEMSGLTLIFGYTKNSKMSKR